MLSRPELAMLDTLRDRWSEQRGTDDLLWRYYHGKQRVEQIGMAIPPALRRFLVITNWPRVVVDVPTTRQQVRALILPGEDTADPTLRQIMEASNFGAHFRMFNRDRAVFGRSFMSVGTREGSDLPLIRAESPREIAAEVDVRREVMTSAARFYGATKEVPEPQLATLYLDGQTVWCALDKGRWVEVDRDTHGEQIPLIMHLNRRETGGWQGWSEMDDIIPIADSAVRLLTNLQFAQEAHGMPRKWMTGVSRSDFVDASGTPIPQFEAYFDAIHTVANAAAKVGQLTASDLKNFGVALDEYRKEAAMLYGFPVRYFSITTVNPPSEGTVTADEINLVRSVEATNEELGVSLGWVAALAYYLKTGTKLEGASVRCDWHSPATPTIAQRTDALVKQRQVGAISRRTLWEELGWSEARMDQEEARLAAEASDPEMQIALGLLSGNAG